jgi:hypothetical protein
VVWDLEDAESDRKPFRWIKVQLPSAKAEGSQQDPELSSRPGIFVSKQICHPDGAAQIDRDHRRTQNAILDGMEYRSLT